MAGRLKGSARVPGSGRQRGTPNKRTIEAAAAFVAAAAAADVKLSDAVLARIDAIDVLKYVMRTALKANQITLAMDAASRLGPFQAPKLQNVMVDTMQKRQIIDYTDAELEEVGAGRLELTPEAAADADARSEAFLENEISRLKAELDARLRAREAVGKVER